MQRRSEDDTLDLRKLPPLPSGWTWSLPSDFCKVVASGSTPKPDKMYAGSGDVPFIKVYNLTDRGILDFSNKPTFIDRETHLGPLARSRAFPGDVLINIVGPPLGKVSIVPDDFPEWNINQAVVIFRPREGVLSKYLAFALQTDSIMRRVTSLAKATAGQHNIGVNMCRSLLPIPIAPLNEQRRIVATIEELFSDLDAGIVALKRAKANLKNYRAAVLKAAVEGKLTAQWRAEHPEVEPASKVIERTACPTKPARYKSRSVDVIEGHAALSVGHTWTKLPAGWAWAPLVNVAKMESGHTPSRNHPEWWCGDVPWVGILDAKAHHGGLIYTTLQHTNADGLANSAARLLPTGTVCVSRTAASIGYVIVLGRPMATSQDFVNWVPTDVVTSDWLRLVFMVDREVLVRFGKGSTHKTVYFPEWLSLHVAIPPLSEQRRIVDEVDARLSQAQAAEKHIENGLLRAARLRQSILKDAFEGKLVSQHPTDESASALLPRIGSSQSAHAGNGEVREDRSQRRTSKQTKTNMHP